MTRFCSAEWSLFVLLAIGVYLGGCGKAAERAPARHGAAAQAEAQGKQSAAFSAEERALIQKQKTCPVSGEPLGSMGEPVKVVVRGRTVFLCCPGCEEKIQKDPDKYLAKLTQ